MMRKERNQFYGLSITFYGGTVCFSSLPLLIYLFVFVCVVSLFHRTFSTVSVEKTPVGGIVVGGIAVRTGFLFVYITSVFYIYTVHSSDDDRSKLVHGILVPWAHIPELLKSSAPLHPFHFARSKYFQTFSRPDLSHSLPLPKC